MSVNITTQIMQTTEFYYFICSVLQLPCKSHMSCVLKEDITSKRATYPSLMKILTPMQRFQCMYVNVCQAFSTCITLSHVSPCTSETGRGCSVFSIRGQNGKNIFSLISFHIFQPPTRSSFSVLSKHHISDPVRPLSPLSSATHLFD